MQVLLTSVRKTLKSELGKKQRKLRRKYNVLMSAINNRQKAEAASKTNDQEVVVMQPEEESTEDILGLDGFFSSLKKVNSTKDEHPC